MTSKEVVQKVMNNEELPYAIAREVFYLDANNRIINLLNHLSNDKSEWDIRDYMCSLFEKAMDWVETDPKLLDTIRNSGKLDEMTHVDDNVLIPSIVLASIKRHENRKELSFNPEVA